MYIYIYIYIHIYVYIYIYIYTYAARFELPSWRRWRSTAAARSATKEDEHAVSIRSTGPRVPEGLGGLEEKGTV